MWIALDLVCLFDSKQNKHSFYTEKDCIKKFCSDLKELRTKIQQNTFQKIY